MSEMRVLTVRQPWAWAIIHGGKDVENRTRNLAGDYRGPVAIHAGLRDDDDAFEDDHPMHGLLFGPCPYRGGVEHNEFRCEWCAEISPSKYGYKGTILGVVDLVDAHDRYCDTDDHPICSEWAEFDVWHLALANPRPLAEPIPYRGGLGLRRLDDGTRLRVEAGVQHG